MFYKRLLGAWKTCSSCSYLVSYAGAAQNNSGRHQKTSDNFKSQNINRKWEDFFQFSLLILKKRIWQVISFSKMLDAHPCIRLSHNFFGDGVKRWEWEGGVGEEWRKMWKWGNSADISHATFTPFYFINTQFVRQNSARGPDRIQWSVISYVLQYSGKRLEKWWLLQ